MIEPRGTAPPYHQKGGYGVGRPSVLLSGLGSWLAEKLCGRRGPPRRVGEEVGGGPVAALGGGASAGPSTVCYILSGGVWAAEEPPRRGRSGGHLRLLHSSRLGSRGSRNRRAARPWRPDRIGCAVSTWQPPKKALGMACPVRDTRCSVTVTF